MKLATYQSEIVLSILKEGKRYNAKPSIGFSKEYTALIDILKLNCKCPVFTVVEGKKQKSAGRVSGAVRMVLEVPDDKVKLTDFEVWADFMYYCKNSSPTDYKKLRNNSEEFNPTHYKSLMQNLKEQRPLHKYEFPQAILEYIEPEWLVSYRKMPKKQERIDFFEKIINFFR